MAQFIRDTVSIHYEIFGEGFPILALAPGGLRSSISLWDKFSPWNPLPILAQDYRVIALDQRNAGQSFAPITKDDSWNTYRDDHLALLDYLQIEKAHLIGACIGGAFIANLLASHPERFSSAAIIQTIGNYNNQKTFYEIFDTWQKEVSAQHPEAGEQDFADFKENLFNHEFVFSVTPQDLYGVNVPLLILQGDDIYHPKIISEQLAKITSSPLITQWKDSEHQEVGISAIIELFRAHTP